MTDSAIKRRAAANVAMPFLGTGTTPNSAKPEYWRRIAGYGYALAVGVVSNVNKKRRGLLKNMGRGMG